MSIVFFIYLMLENIKYCILDSSTRVDQTNGSPEVIDGRQSVHGNSRELFVGRRLLLYRSSSSHPRSSMTTFFF